MTTIDPYVKRTARAGDVIESIRGQFYRVDEVHRTAGGGRATLYGVTGIANGLPNAFEPREVAGVLRRPQALDALEALNQLTIQNGALKALRSLDGSTQSAVTLLTGMTAQELAELGEEK